MVKKKHKGLTFWEKVRFKYKLSFLNENTLEEVFSFRVSRLSVFLTFILFVLLLIGLTSIVIINTPIRNYLPGYLAIDVRREMVESALKADSLKQTMSTQALYFNNLRGILRGDLQIDSVKSVDTLSQKLNLKDLERQEVTSRFVKKFEEEEKYNLTTFSTSVSIPENIVFYRPVRGIVSSHFNVKTKHYGTDIEASLDESVLSTLKGTVVFTGFDANSGYVMQIQHPNGFISIYKHNASLLKNVGDEVNAGEAIALVGNTGKQAVKSHLHFELWYKGTPVNAEELILF